MSNIIDLKEKSLFPNKDKKKKSASNTNSLLPKKKPLEKTEAKESEPAKQKQDPVATDREKNQENIPQQIEWTAKEFIKHQKDPAWFLVGGLIALFFLIFAIFTKNYVFAFVIILAAFSIFIWAQKEPKKVRFIISGKGISTDNETHTYDNLKSFWVFYDPPEIKHLSVESKKLLIPRIMIPLENENPNKIREFLLKYLPEEEQQESLIDILARYLRY